MSDNCCTFAPEIGIDLFRTSPREADRATQGCDPRGIARRKTHTPVTEGIRVVVFTDFGLQPLYFSQL